ncbi:hypothetical protein E2C01_049631 [Portunus trituberculatus]|uniref:Uncharacterized protein n=1 Tax=Portunus trituberculatus TaxID=210409 RepID=A0A5B7GEE1_PORTR|nr:hypothetical protein [Portunus trituberculatus]
MMRGWRCCGAERADRAKGTGGVAVWLAGSIMNNGGNKLHAINLTVADISWQGGERRVVEGEGCVWCPWSCEPWKP